MDKTADEVKRLRSCINDLISVLALAAIWSGSDSSRMLGTLLDSLLAILRLDFACARLNLLIDGSPIELVRLAERRNPSAQAQEVGRLLGPWLNGDQTSSRFVIPNPAGEGEVAIASLSLGLHDQVGVLMAGSRRTDFPTDIELLLLRVAANQAAIGLQEARRSGEQKGIAEALERRVAERTSQLTAVNEELRRSIEDRKQAEETLRQAQADLTRVNRVTTMGELTASLAHEVNQPIAAAVTNANTCLRWLAADTPNLEEARAAATRIVKDGKRAGEIINRIRLLFKKGTPERELVDVNEVIQEMIVLLSSEAIRYSVTFRTELAEDLPQVIGDRVQLQQVFLNLMLNGLDAMKDADAGRELTIKSHQAENGQLLISVSDTGVGLPPHQGDHIFDAFFTTKPHGTGMGLRISRSIIESHGGRLWAADNFPCGASFCFTLPTKIKVRSAAHL